MSFGKHTDKRPYSLLFLGEKKKAADSFKGMNQALIIALAVIFFMLTALFKSLIDPLVVMFAIPFGFIGVVMGMPCLVTISSFYQQSGCWPYLESLLTIHL